MGTLLAISMMLTTAIVAHWMWQSFRWQGWGK
jgi:hypothetical protein